jgi:hypothetical protein
MQIMGHVFDIKSLLVAVLKGLSPTPFFLLIINKIFLSKSKRDKHLTIETIGRRIIVENLENLPLLMVDEMGNSIYNCYSIEFRIWNKGKEVIRAQDISQSEPFTLEISNEARVIASPVMSVDAGNMGLEISNLENGKFKIDFEFINPDEWLEICFLVTGNPNAKVSAGGRIAGQKSPGFDISIDDGRASVGERLISLFVILLTLSPILLVIGFIWLCRVLQDYPLEILLLEPDHIPESLGSLLLFGSMVPTVYIFYSVNLWIKRKRHPENYPLIEDYEPRPIQSFIAH